MYEYYIYMSTVMDIRDSITIFILFCQLLAVFPDSKKTVGVMELRRWKGVWKIWLTSLPSSNRPLLTGKRQRSMSELPPRRPFANRSINTQQTQVINGESIPSTLRFQNWPRIAQLSNPSLYPLQLWQEQYLPPMSRLTQWQWAEPL